MIAAEPVDPPAAETPVQPAPPKLDPEMLAIRVRPERAIRIKRWAVIALSAFGMILLLFAAWAALRDGGSKKVAVHDQSELGTNAATDSLNALAKTYADVPKLGPPLPGDLGKPMLDRELRDRGGYDAVPNDGQRVAQTEDAAQQQQAAETKAALQSGLLVNASSSPQQTVSNMTSTAGPTPPSAEANAGSEIEPVRDPNGQIHKASFMATLLGEGSVDSHAPVPAPSPNLLSAGSIIAASLITGLRSDLPGLVVAQVTEDVYDSPTGRILLVPQGSRLIGKYDSVVAFGQKRALIVWQRIILPDGGSININNMSASDPSGYAGLQDRVDYHTWQLLKGIAITTILGIGSDLQFSGNGGLVEAIRQSATQNVSRAGDQLTSKALDIQPTITIRPGAPVRLLVERDLVFAPWKGER